jgi:large subunit ribosomal protein L13
MIIDATNLILGRMGTTVAKKALLGEDIQIVNCENAVITGKKEVIYGKYKAQDKRGSPMAGPFQPKQPDRFVKRAIRGMLNYKETRGREAFKRIICYRGVPEEFQGKKLQTLDNAKLPKGHARYLTVKEVTDLLKQKNE